MPKLPALGGHSQLPENGYEKLKMRLFVMDNYAENGVKLGVPKILEAVGRHYVTSFTTGNTNPHLPTIIAQALDSEPGDHPPADEIQRLIEEDFVTGEMCQQTSVNILNHLPSSFENSLWDEAVKRALYKLSSKHLEGVSPQTQTIIDKITHDAINLHRTTLDFFSQAILTDAILTSTPNDIPYEEELKTLQIALPEVEKIIIAEAEAEFKKMAPFLTECIAFMCQYYDHMGLESKVIHPVLLKMGEAISTQIHKKGEIPKTIDYKAAIRAAVTASAPGEYETPIPPERELIKAFENGAHTIARCRILSEEVLTFIPNDPDWPTAVRNTLLAIGLEATQEGSTDSPLHRIIISMGQNLLRAGSPTAILGANQLNSHLIHAFTSEKESFSFELLKEIKTTLIRMSEREYENLQTGPNKEVAIAFATRDRETRQETTLAAIDFFAKHNGMCNQAALLQDLQTHVQTAQGLEPDENYDSTNAYRNAHFPFSPEALALGEYEEGEGKQAYELAAFRFSYGPEGKLKDLRPLESLLQTALTAPLAVASTVSPEPIEDALITYINYVTVVFISLHKFNKIENLSVIGVDPNSDEGIWDHPIYDMNLAPDYESPIPVTLHVDEKLITYHLISGAFRLMGINDRSIYEKEARDQALAGIMELTSSIPAEASPNSPITLIHHFLPELFAKADVLFNMNELIQASHLSTQYGCTQALLFLEDHPQIHGGEIIAALNTQLSESSKGSAADYHQANFGINFLTADVLYQEYEGEISLADYCAAWVSHPDELPAQPQDIYMATSINSTLARIAGASQKKSLPRSEQFSFLFEKILHLQIILNATQGVQLITGSELTEEKSADIRARFELSKEFTLHTDEKVMVFHILKGIFDFMESTLDPLNPQDRRRILREIQREATKITGATNHILPQIFKRADELFGSATAASPTPKKEPAKEPVIPTLKTIPFPNFQRVIACATGLPSFKTLKKKKEARRQKNTQNAIDDAINRCRTMAVFVSEDIPGLVANIEQKRSCDRITACYIERQNLEAKVISPPNTASKGYFDIQFGKDQGKPVLCRLEYTIDNNANLTVTTGDGETYGPSDFVGKGKSVALGNFYQELRRITLEGLAERLERQDYEKRSRFIQKSGPRSRKALPTFKTQKGGVVRPSFTDLDPSLSPRKEKSIPTIDSATNHVLELIKKIQKSNPEDPVTTKMLESIVLYKNFPQTDANGEKRDIYLAVDTTDALIQLANGKMSKSEVYLCLRRRGIERSGYHPYEPKDKPGVLMCTPRGSSSQTDDLRAITEKVLGIKLSDEGIADLTTITVAPEIQEVLIGTREEIENTGGRQIVRDEISKIRDYALEVLAKEGSTQPGRARVTMQEIQTMLIEEERPVDLTDETQELVHQIYMDTQNINGRITHIVFNAPQNPRFSQGIFDSLSNQEALLKDRLAKAGRNS
jgi:hypothetical protein